MQSSAEDALSFPHPSKEPAQETVDGNNTDHDTDSLNLFAGIISILVQTGRARNLALLFQVAWIQTVA